MRSASSPNIYYTPSQTQLAPSPNRMVPPIPLVPHNYVQYSSGPTAINRSQDSSPTSPTTLTQREQVRKGSPVVQEIAPRINGGMNGTPKPHSQFKLRVKYGDDEFVIIAPYDITYVKLVDRIERKVKLCVPGPDISPIPNVKIRYLDEDGDYISMDSDDDVKMAFDGLSEPGQNDSAGVLTLSVST